MSKKYIEVKVRVNVADYLDKDQLGQLEYFLDRSTNRIKDQISDAVVDKALTELDINELLPSHNELKAVVLDKMAEKAIEQAND